MPHNILKLKRKNRLWCLLETATEAKTAGAKHHQSQENEININLLKTFDNSMSTHHPLLVNNIYYNYGNNRTGNWSI